MPDFTTMPTPFFQSAGAGRFQEIPKLMSGLTTGLTISDLRKSLLEGTLEAMMWKNGGLPVFLWVEVIFT